MTLRPWIERLRSRTAAFVHDLLVVPVAWLLAYWTRFNLEQIPPKFLETALWSLPLVMAVSVAVYAAFGLYRGVWRFASLPDLVRITQAALAATTLVVLLLFVINRMENVPRSVPPLFLMLQLLLLAGPRLLYRWFKDHRLTLRPKQRVLVVGADRAGEMLVRDMLRDRAGAYLPVAFVDDKLRRHGGAIHGVPIKGSAEQIPRLVESLGIDLIMLAVPGASDAEMQALVDLCERTGRPLRTVPQFSDLVEGQVTVHQLRPVSIEDLLGRNPVTLDWEQVRAGLAGRVVLITGAGGSIGSELCRQVLAAGPRRLVLVDHGEFNLYRIEAALTEGFPGLSLGRHLLDVGDQPAMAALFARERPQIVFHAAAYKHVPLLQDQVRAAVRNNVFGTGVVARCALAAGCERFVLISTDKAVNPANVMGATKRIAELLCQTLAPDVLADGASPDRHPDPVPAEPRTRFITVRFGNVLGSAGSVVPLFQRQIEQGGPVTVTDPRMERYFMTIPEACQLIMQAAVQGDGGETFVLDMGRPVRIAYLAEQMIRLAGREPGRDIAIRYVGLRPGEKLYEELFYPVEDLLPTAHPKLRAARRQPIDRTATSAALAALRAALDDNDEHAMVRAMRRLVPQWQADTTDAATAPYPDPSPDPSPGPAPAPASEAAHATDQPALRASPEPHRAAPQRVSPARTEPPAVAGLP